MEEQQDGWMHAVWRVLEWSKTTLMVIGFIAVVGFLKVNMLGQDVSMQFPTYVPPTVQALIDQERRAQEWEEEQVVKRQTQKKGR